MKSFNFAAISQKLTNSTVNPKTLPLSQIVNYYETKIQTNRRVNGLGVFMLNRPCLPNCYIICTAQKVDPSRPPSRLEKIASRPEGVSAKLLHNREGPSCFFPAITASAVYYLAAIVAAPFFLCSLRLMFIQMVDSFRNL